MQLKTTYQWDINTQEDLETFRNDSEEIHRGAERVLYRRVGECEEEKGQVEYGEVKSRSRSRRVIGKTQRKTQEKTQEKTRWEQIPPQDPHMQFYSREGFINGIARDLESDPERREEEIKGVGMVVKALVEHRDGRAVRAVFVETQDTLLPYLQNLNDGGDILAFLHCRHHGEGFFVETPEGEVLIEKYDVKDLLERLRNATERLLQDDLDFMEKNMIDILLSEEVLDRKTSKADEYKWERNYRLGKLMELDPAALDGAQR